MPIKVEAFKCSYCNKLCHFYWTALRHEASCRNNPAARHCITCVHGISACCGTDPDWSDPFGPGTERNGPYCGHHNMPISKEPYFIDCDFSGGINIGFGSGSIPIQPIPYTCSHYQSKGKAEWTPEDQYNGGQENE